MSRFNQSGVALVTVLLVVAAVGILTASMTYELQIDIQRTAALKRGVQTDHYAYGLEEWARVILKQDHEKTGQLDSNQEVWAQSVPPIDLPEGRLTGRMSDLDGRFNLNNLFAGGRQQSLQVTRFKRLLTLLGLEETLAESVMDWQDSDIAPQQGGAEDPAYLRRSPAYRAANQGFRHVSELRLVNGFDEDRYQRIRPHVAALPIADGPTAINVNTATPEVLQSIHPAITPTLATRLHRDGFAEYKNLSEFFNQPEFTGLVWQNLIGTISVDSHYFLAHGVIEIDDRVQHYFSLVEQGPASFQVIERIRGQYE